MVLDSANIIPNNTPPTIAKSKEKNVSLMVNSIALSKDGPSVSKVAPILLGAGIK